MLLISNAFKGEMNEAVRWHSIGLDIFEFTYFGQFSTFVITCQVTELCALFFTHTGACRSRMILTALFTNFVKILRLKRYFTLFSNTTCTWGILLKTFLFFFFCTYRGLRNVCFSENLAYFVSLLPPS